MSYRVGIDFGTTFTAAAVHRDAQTVELVPLGDNGTATASVIFLAPDGSLIMGEAAARRAITDPDRVVREVKRRIGDQIPMLVAGEPVSAQVLAARFIRWVADRVSEREGAEPAGIAVTYPASWGPHKRALLGTGLADAGLDNCTLVTEPEAAAVAYAASQHVEPGSAIGVYDLGGGTFDAAIVRQLEVGGFELAGHPEGIDSLGGIDFDEAVFDQVRASLGQRWAALDFDDPMVRTAAAALRRECTEAKTALSSDTEVTIPVMLPGLSTKVRMVRAELEALIGPAIDATIDALRLAMESAGLRPADLSAVLLVGGSSRIPLVAQRVSAELDLPVTADSDPKAVVAIGAALSIAPETRTSVGPVLASPPAEPGRSPRRVVSAVVGLAVCAAAMVALAGSVGTDILPTGGSTTEGDIAAPGLGEQAPAPKPDAVDSWTGEPYAETTPPGPKRPKSKPAQASPSSLSPAPTTSNDRAALIAGAPSSPAAPDAGSSSAQSAELLSGGEPSSEQPAPSQEPSTTPAPTPTQEPSTTQDPPPPQESSPVPEPSTTQEPPPTDPSTDPPPRVHRELHRNPAAPTEHRARRDTTDGGPTRPAPTPGGHRVILVLGGRQPGCRRRGGAAVDEDRPHARRVRSLGPHQQR